MLMMMMRTNERDKCDAVVCAGEKESSIIQCEAARVAQQNTMHNSEPIQFSILILGTEAKCKFSISTILPIFQIFPLMPKTLCPEATTHCMVELNHPQVEIWILCRVICHSTLI